MFNSPKKTSVAFKKILFHFFLVSCFITNIFAQQTVMFENSMVQKFYIINHQNLFWFSSDKNISRAAEWLTTIDAAGNLGFVSNKLQTEQIHTALFGNSMIDSAYKARTDKQITGLVLNFLKVLQQGNINFDYDEISIDRDSVYINQLLNSEDKEPVSKIVAQLDCKDHEYLVLKKYLNDSISVKDTLKYKKVLLFMNYRRYLTVNHHSEYIVVNIPAAEASYFRNDSLKLTMRTVMGMKKKPTPIIASYMTSIVTFPYWSVPRSIALKEILPKVQKNENYLEQNNFDVVDAKGNVIEDSELNWKNYNEKNFPYYFRQATGSDNALGVLKFDFQNPFSIFLHGTSWPAAFANNYRFLSHGCIRLEKPFELANALLRGMIDLEELKSGKKNTKSNLLKLPHITPIYIIYMPVKVDGEKVSFLQDVYGLIK